MLRVGREVERNILYLPENMPVDYVRPLTSDQMSVLSFIHNAGANSTLCHGK